ncbi:hypothetical protein J1N35_034103 [Gossypium stocksii]|uniref:Uncharacterized protein n=1 Tax=Gossypium stocksii TaxID=47602 RepID=A0A9D3URI3_9ROSI|nr:hypothetical protein J1N35_034103 [Gossypium stocksii]
MGNIKGLDELRIGKREIVLDTTIWYCGMQIVMYKALGLEKGTLWCLSMKV